MKDSSLRINLPKIEVWFKILVGISSQINNIIYRLIHLNLYWKYNMKNPEIVVEVKIARDFYLH